MQHILVQQLKKKSEVLVVVKEVVLTTGPCSLTHTRRNQCSLMGALSLLSSVQVCLCVCVTVRVSVTECVRVFVVQSSYVCYVAN